MTAITIGRGEAVILQMRQYSLKLRGFRWRAHMYAQEEKTLESPSLQKLADNLADSEARNQAVLEAAVDSILTIDERGLIQSVNAATIKTFGYEASELLGRNINMLMPNPYSAEHDEYLRRYVTTGVKRIIGIGREVIGRRKNGSTFPMDLSVSEVKLPGKRLFTGIVRDITDRKQVEEALLSERNRFQQYLDIAGVIIISLDLNGAVQLMNRKAIEQMNIVEEEALGRTLQELFPSEVEFLGGVAKAVGSDSTQSWESPLSSQATGRTIAWHSSPLKQRDGGITGTLLSGADITERVRAQDSLAKAHHQLEQRVQERTQELCQANDELRDEISERIKTETRLAASLKEKEVLLKEIHHRVKNNLQLISSLLSLQVRSRKGMTIEQLVYEIQGRIQSIALLHEMLYQSGDLVHVDFAKYIDTLSQTIVRYYGMASRINVLAEAEDIKLSLDGSIYCGLLLNELITNALKHAFPGGRSGNLSINAKRVSPARVTLSVRDDGVGLKSDFDITKMTSLGLELVQQLTTKLHGEMKISNEGGAGFEFIFEDGG